MYFLLDFKLPYLSLDTKFQCMRFTSKQKSEFRETPQWIVFRKYFLTLRNYTCEFCGETYSKPSSQAQLNVHHRYETDYTNLDPARFLLLCRTCHQFIHKKYKKPAFADRLLAGLKD